MATKERKTRQPPILAVGRRGGVSVLDAIVSVLWSGQPEPDSDTDWPAMRLKDIRDAVAEYLGYDVSGSTVRSTVYSRPELFEKTEEDGFGLRYRLSASFRRTLK